mgnify:CR=1 FL=1
MPIIFPEGHVFPRIEYHEYLNQQQKCSLLKIGNKMENLVIKMIPIGHRLIDQRVM